MRFSPHMCCRTRGWRHGIHRLRWIACSAPTWLRMVPAMLPTQRNTTHTVRAMHEIICPHCSKAFKIDEAGYADILKQVRDGEFEQALHERLELAEREKHNAIALAKAEVTNALQKAAAAKDTEIQALKAQLDAGEVVRKLAVARLVRCWPEAMRGAALAFKTHGVLRYS